MGHCDDVRMDAGNREGCVTVGTIRNFNIERMKNHGRKYK